MSDKKKKKYKGFICAPAVTTNHKSTREWCKGRPGIEHDWWWFDSERDYVAGLPTKQYEKCRACGKHSPRYETRTVRHGFGAAVKAFRAHLGITQEQLAAKLNTAQSRISTLELDANSPSLRTMEEIAEGLGLKLVVELAKRVDNHRWRYDGVFISTPEKDCE